MHLKAQTEQEGRGKLMLHPGGAFSSLLNLVSGLVTLIGIA